MAEEKYSLRLTGLKKNTESQAHRSGEKYRVSGSQG
jgi:hypothetical protein